MESNTGKGVLDDVGDGGGIASRGGAKVSCLRAASYAPHFTRKPVDFIGYCAMSGLGVDSVFSEGTDVLDGVVVGA